MTDLLEIIEVSGDPPAPTPPRSHARWIWAVFALVVLGLFVIVPLRLTVARSEVERLEGQWRTAQAVDSGRAEVISALQQRASPADGAQVTVGTGAANQESAGLLRRVSAALGHDLVVDPGVRHLRQAMARAVSLDVRQLAPAGGSSPVDAAAAAEVRASQMLSAQLARFSLRARGALPPRQLSSADPALSALGHILDSPAQGRLLIGTPSGLDLADLDQGTVSRPQVDGISQTVDRIIPRQGWVAVTTLFQEGIEQLYSVPASLHGAARPLVPVVNGPAVFAGTRPDTVWVQRLDGPVEEVDGTGRVVTGPFTLPENGALEGVVDSGLVVAMGVSPDPLTLAVWDPSSRQVTRVIVQGAAFVSAAGKETIAWVTLGDSLRLTDLSTGATMAVSGPAGGSGGEGALSPDGRYFATAFIDAQHEGPLPAVVDVTTGAVRFPRRPAGDIFSVGGFAWSPSSDRLYITASHAGFRRPGDALVWPLAGDTLSYLRLHGDPVLALGPL